MQSADVSAGDYGTAAQHNLLREDIVRGGGDYATTAGSANVQTLSIDAQYDSYTAGDMVKFKAGYTNTGAMTLNVNSLGAKSVKTYQTTGKVDVMADDVVAGQLYLAWYDGTDFVLLNSTNTKDFIKVTAGATIAVNTVVCYYTVDNEWVGAQANASWGVRARGIAVTPGTDGNPMLIQTSGVYKATSGTPFTAEAQHYLSDTQGALSTTPSTTTVVPVGYAISTTEIILTWGKKMASGTGTSQNSTTSETITTGFRAEHLILMGRAVVSAGSTEEKGAIHYIGGVAAGGFLYEGSASVDSGRIGTNIAHSGNSLAASNFTDTSFDIDTVYASGTGTDSIRWIAIGE